jgi:signal peptidase I
MLLACVLLSTGCGAVETIKVVGGAMEPTLNDGDRVWVTRVFDQLERGDIVGFRSPRDESRSFLKRIVGLPGERIEMVDGVVSINGRSISEPYVDKANRSSDTWGPITIPAGEYFMMGDNRRHSMDSRSWGTVRRDLIWAKPATH